MVHGQVSRRRGEGAGVGGAVYILAGEEGRCALSERQAIG